MEVTEKSAEGLDRLPADVHLAVTSPPYADLISYGAISSVGQMGDMALALENAVLPVIRFSPVEYTDSKSGARILMVDDDTHLLASIRRNLRARFAVTTATSGEEGLERLEAICLDQRELAPSEYSFIRSRSALSHQRKSSGSQQKN